MSESGTPDAAAEPPSPTMTTSATVDQVTADQVTVDQVTVGGSEHGPAASPVPRDPRVVPPPVKEPQPPREPEPLQVPRPPVGPGQLATAAAHATPTHETPTHETPAHETAAHETADQAAREARPLDERLRAAGKSIPKHRSHVPSPHDLAELSGAFAMTANVHDPDPSDAEPATANRPVSPAPQHIEHDHDDVVTERGLRGLVGGGASQVSVVAALRARDAARPTDDDLAAADRDLVIVKRGWVPREDLPRPGRRP